MGTKLLEVCFSIHFMSDSSFVKVMIKAAKLHYTLKDGSAANFVGVRNLGGAVLTKFY